MTAILASAVYLLCAATSAECMLLWSTLCFIGLTANNFLLFADLVLLPGVDLRWPRHLTALAAVLVLLYGFIWETS